MNSLSLFLVVSLAILVLLILVLGLINMLRNPGVQQAKRSNRLMQSRVALQFIAVAVALALLLFW